MSGNPTRTAELYVGLTRVTLKAGRCALNASYNEFDCDWFIQTKVKYNYNKVCTLTVSNQIIWFSIEFFTFQVTLKMKKVLGLTFYMTKPDMTLHTFPLYTSTLHTYCLFLHGTEALLYWFAADILKVIILVFLVLFGWWRITQRANTVLKCICF